jgi:large subunit ribosomal protein L31
MKKDIHPKYGPVTIVMPNGDKFETFSTMSNDILVDVDYREHSAWKGGVSTVNTRSNQVADFNKKFGGIFAMPSASA